uniref:Uncharacterized protein n=1 Tax=Oryza brachyantha TaxID=4533 RepID=J3N0Y1_ORYBR
MASFGRLDDGEMVHGLGREASVQRRHRGGAPAEQERPLVYLFHLDSDASSIGPGSVQHLSRGLYEGWPTLKSYSNICGAVVAPFAAASNASSFQNYSLYTAIASSNGVRLVAPGIEFSAAHG